MLGAVWHGARRGRDRRRPSPVTPVVRFKALPFPLQDVRLLDGPFRDAMVRDQQYLLELDPDRLLHNFRVNAGLPSTAKPLGGWEAPDVELRGHTVGHYLSALRADVREHGRRAVQGARRPDGGRAGQVPAGVAVQGLPRRVSLGLSRGA